jgi:hypothetical protein
MKKDQAVSAFFSIFLKILEAFSEAVKTFPRLHRAEPTYCLTFFSKTSKIKTNTENFVYSRGKLNNLRKKKE